VLHAASSLWHIVPEAQVGGPIALIHDGDEITIDSNSRRLDVNVSDEELEKRRQSWTEPKWKYEQGVLYKFMRDVQDASLGLRDRLMIKSTYFIGYCGLKIYL